MDESTHDRSEPNAQRVPKSSFVISRYSANRGTSDPRKVLLGAGMQHFFLGPDKQAIKHFRKPAVHDLLPCKSH